MHALKLEQSMNHNFNFVVHKGFRPGRFSSIDWKFYEIGAGTTTLLPLVNAIHCSPQTTLGRHNTNVVILFPDKNIIHQTELIFGVDGNVGWWGWAPWQRYFGEKGICI